MTGARQNAQGSIISSHISRASKTTSTFPEEYDKRGVGEYLASPSVVAFY
jgi:hypothetical protein